MNLFGAVNASHSTGFLLSVPIFQFTGRNLAICSLRFGFIVRTVIYSKLPLLFCKLKCNVIFNPMTNHILCFKLESFGELLENTR